MNRADELARRIVNDLTGTTKKSVTNDNSDDDSVVEHVVDVDVEIDGYAYDVQIYVTRFSKVD